MARSYENGRRRRVWIIVAIVIATVWIGSSAMYLHSGPVALIAGPLSVPFLLPTLYQRYVGEPTFRRELQRGMTRDQVRELSEKVHAYAYRADYYDPFDPDADKLDQRLANVRFTHRATFCVADGDMWTIRFNAAGRVVSWIEKPFGENC